MLAHLVVPRIARRSPARQRGFCDSESRMLNHRVETWALRADGTRFPVELAITRIPLDGPPVFTGFIRDITARKKRKRRFPKARTVSVDSPRQRWKEF